DGKIVENKIFINNKIFPDASTIGMHAYFYSLDPPCHPETKIELGINAQLQLATNTYITSGAYITAGNNALIEIGENTYFAHEIKINCKNHIKIGKNCLIGYQTIMMDYDGHMIFQKSDADKAQYMDSGKINPVVIGDNVWIGIRVTILK